MPKPPALPPAERARADIAQCRVLLAAGSRSFHAASRLMPARVRDDATVLYAFCRLSDDAVDMAGAASDAVERLRARLAAAYQDRPADTPVDRALAALIARTGLPRALPEALLEGLAWDLDGRRYPDSAALTAYAARVAGAVGAMMTVLMGVRSRAALARAADLGLAMQFTNIARDIGEDARAGRLYLPLAWCADAGLDPEAFLAAPRFGPPVARIAARLLAAAEAFYARAEPGIALLPLACRPAVHGAHRIYRAIGGEIARAGFDSVGQRAVVRGRTKLALLVQAAALSVSPRSDADAPPAPETAFLVEAAARPEALQGGAIPLWSALDRGAGRMLDLIGRVDARRSGMREA